MRSPKTAATASTRHNLATVWPDSRPNTATRCRARTTSPWPSAITTSRATQHVAYPHGYPGSISRPDRTLRTRSHHRRFRVNPFAGRLTRTRHRHRPSARCPRRPDYESLARKGETMSTAEIATYAYDQIDQARQNSNTLVELRESCVQRDSGAGVLNRLQQSVQPRRGKPSPGLRREQSQSCSQTHRSCACAGPERLGIYRVPSVVRCAARVPDAPRALPTAAHDPTPTQAPQGWPGRPPVGRQMDGYITEVEERPQQANVRATQ